MRAHIPPKVALYVPIIAFSIVLLSILGWIAWSNRPISVAKQKLTYINNMPLPAMPAAYQLTDSNTDGFPTKFYVTLRSASQATSDVRRICSVYGFSDAQSSNGTTTENGVTFKQMTLQCYRGDKDGWQFDIDSFPSAHVYKQFDPTASLPASISKSAAITSVTVMSIGAPVTNG